VPVADAGATQTVNEGATGTLDGSKSADADGDPIHYRWTQVAGPTVALSDVTAQKPTFTAPLVDADTVLRFQLVVDDGKTSSVPSTVDVTVHDLPVPDMATGPDMAQPPAVQDMAQGGSADMAQGGGADMAQGGEADMAQLPPLPPDMAKGGGHEGGCSCSTTGSSRAPALPLPLMALALFGFAVRRIRRRRS